MPFNGAGAYSPPGTDFPAVASTLIESTKFNNVINDIATALSSCIAKDGQTTVTANIPFGGFKLQEIGTGVIADDGANLTNLQNGTGLWAGTAGGTADALTLSLTPALTAYVAGQMFRFKAGASDNTGATTVAINGLTAKTIQLNGAALVAGDITADNWYEILYDGTNFQLARVGQPSQTALIESGTKMVFQQTAAPTGWTKDTTHNDKSLRVVSGTASSGGATAFTSVFGSGKSTSAFTLTTGEIPSHTHSVTPSTSSTGQATNTITAAGNPGTVIGNAAYTANATGSGGSHAHTLSLDLQYVDLIIATKD